MSDGSSTGELVYEILKRSLLDGSLDSRVRVDVAELAERHDVSATPVREAAMRLLGEGLLEPHPRGGVRPLFFTEVRLRATLDLHARLCLLAVDWRDDSPLRSDPLGLLDHEPRTRAFFLRLAGASGNAGLSAIFDRQSDLLAPFRRLEPILIARTEEELCDLDAALRAGHVNPLRRLLRSYHRRRRSIVAQLIWRSSQEQWAGSEAR